MAEEIPSDFDHKWGQADVSLVTVNSEDKLLYANKAVLSVFSPMLRAKFSQNFKEGTQTSVEVSVDYVAMLEILRIVFHIYYGCEKAYSSIEIASIYRTADYLDIAFIRKMCIERILQQPSADMAMASLELELHDVMMKTLLKLKPNDVDSFVKGYSKHRSPANSATNIQALCCFSKNDIYTIYRLITGQKMAITKVAAGSVINLKDIANDSKDEGIDVTKKWFASNVEFQTKNSNELLYANRETLASVSGYFRKILFDESMAEEMHGGPTFSVFQLNVEYATMKTILSLFCNSGFVDDSENIYHPVLLFDMWRISSCENLDIPIVRSLCEAKILKHPTLANAEVAIKLGLEGRSKMLQSLDLNTLQQWLHCSDKNLSYLNDGKEVVISVRRTDPVLSLSDVRYIIEKLTTTNKWIWPSGLANGRPGSARRPEY